MLAGARDLHKLDAFWWGDAVDASEVKALVYLSGIIPDIPREELSLLRCRFVGLRAAVVLGAASTGFELRTQLAHRFPVTVFPGRR